MNMKSIPGTACLILFTASLLVCNAQGAACAAGAKQAPPGKFLAPGYYIPRPFDAESVTIECSDGYRLTGDYIRRSRMNRRMPAVLFIHEGGRDKRSWYPMTVQLAGRGFAVLSIDLRGHGENPASPSNRKITGAQLKPEDYAKMLDDIRNALSYLSMRPAVESGSIAIIGASLGANLGLAAASQPWAGAVKGVIALSPRLEDHGYSAEKAVTEMGRRHVYLVAAKDDTETYPDAVKLLGLAKGPKELLSVEGTARGAKLFGAALLSKVPAWLVDMLVQDNLALPPADRPSPAKRK